jgi:hypothetical protein
MHVLITRTDWCAGSHSAECAAPQGVRRARRLISCAPVRPCDEHVHAAACHAAHLAAEQLAQQRERLLRAVRVLRRQVHVVEPEQQALARRRPKRVLAAFLQDTLPGVCSVSTARAGVIPTDRAPWPQRQHAASRSTGVCTNAGHACPCSSLQHSLLRRVKHAPGPEAIVFGQTQAFPLNLLSNLRIKRTAGSKRGAPPGRAAGAGRTSGSKS